MLRPNKNSILISAIYLMSCEAFGRDLIKLRNWVLMTIFGLTDSKNMCSVVVKKRKSQIHWMCFRAWSIKLTDWTKKASNLTMLESRSSFHGYNSYLRNTKMLKTQEMLPWATDFFFYPSERWGTYSKLKNSCYDECACVCPLSNIRMEVVSTNLSGF